MKLIEDKSEVILWAAILVLMGLGLLVFISAGCSTERWVAFARSARAGYSQGSGDFDGTTSSTPNGYGMQGSHGTFDGDNTFSSWGVSADVGLLLVGPPEPDHTRRDDDAYHAVLDLEREVGELKAAERARRAAVPPPEMPPVDPPPAPEPEPTLLWGMTQGELISYATILSAAIAAYWQRKNIGEGVKKLVKKKAPSP